MSPPCLNRLADMKIQRWFESIYSRYPKTVLDRDLKTSEVYTSEYGKRVSIWGDATGSRSAGITSVE